MRRNVFKIFTVLIAGFIMSVPGTVSAEKGSFYLSPAMGYHVDAFNADMDRDNSYGFSFALGYDINDSFAVEAQADKIRDLGAKNPVSDLDADLTGYSLNLKYYPASSKDKINGYVLLGLGWMEAEASDNIAGYQKGNGEADDMWGRFGVGSDFVVSDKITFFLEADYSQGFSDLNPIDYYSGKIGFKLYP
jgi:hypothetical protein